LCERWFCEKHLEPRLAFIRDIKAVENSPEVRTLYYTEWKRQDGHPDFAYSQIKLLELDIEEKNRSELIRQALDRMNHYYDSALLPEKPVDVEADRKKRVKTLLKEESELEEGHGTTSKTAKEEAKQTTLTHEKSPKRKPFPIKKIVAVLMGITILSILLWYGLPIIFLMMQNSPSQNPSPQSSYTTLTLVKSSSPSPPQITTVTFGDVDYSFSYVWQNNQYFLLVSNSILEGKTYLQPTNGSVYGDIGIEIKVSEAYSNQIVLLVKPTVQDYLASLSFKKLTIAQGQYQAVSFSGNEYTIGYLQNPPYYVNDLIVTTPLLQSRQYSITSSQIVSCDLGLEIRVYKATTTYAIIFVKPSY